MLIPKHITQAIEDIANTCTCDDREGTCTGPCKDLHDTTPTGRITAPISFMDFIGYAFNQDVDACIVEPLRQVYIVCKEMYDKLPSAEYIPTQDNRLVYISGAIANDKEYEAKFNKIANDLTHNHKVQGIINPAELDMKGATEWHEFFRIALGNMALEATAVVLLSDYLESVGAIIEFYVALLCKIPVYRYELDLLNEDKSFIKHY